MNKKYPKIITDNKRNAPADIIRKFNTEQYYDFAHHTHKMSDIINDGSGSGIGSGANGKSAYEVWLSLGNTGSEQDFINSLKGPNGESAYEAWKALGNTGTEKEFIDSLKGIDGKSAYEIWLLLGNSGTEQDFIDSLKGASGISAYEIWLSLGNSGTENDFINSLKGANGKSAYEVWLSLGNTGSEQDFISSLESVDGKSAYEIWLSLGNTGSEQDFIDSLKGTNATSPTITLSRTEEDNGVIISVTTNNETKSNIVYDGEDGAGSGFLIYDNYSMLPTAIDEDNIIYIKNEYIDNDNNVYPKGFYLADYILSKYIPMTYTIDWVDIINKLFEGVDSKYFSINENSDLTLSDTAFDDINTQLNSIEDELFRKATIDDNINSENVTWSSNRIKSELDKKSSKDANHNHGNLDNVLNKFTVNESNNLSFDSKLIMTADKYDVDSDGKVDYAKTAETLDGLSASSKELNYLQGAKSNIQSQIDAISSGVNFKGEYTNFADMQSSITAPEKGDWVYILVDETKDNQTNTQYVHNGINWIYGGGRTTINEAGDTVKGIIQLSGDLTGSASAPKLIEVTTAKSIGYVKSITVDKNGRVTNITEDNTLAQRLADLESRPQIYISLTQPTNLKDGDIWIEG